MRRVALIVAFVVLLAGCGETTTTIRHPASCQPGRSFAGCSVTGQATIPGRLGLAPVGGPEFPDVSSWQGHPDWGQVFAWQRSHGWPTGGFFKLGEYHVDPDAAYNASQLKGHFHAGYWFVRNTGCQHEGDQIVSTAKSLGVHFVWNDVEVSEARGYSACLLAIERGAGLAAGVYTGPGTWTHDSLPASTPLWDAAYNFHGPEFGGLWRNAADCWQFTDGKYADRTNVPGIGYDDVNVDSGCIKLVNGGTGVKLPVGFRYLDRTVRQFGPVKAQERHTVYVWYAHACKQPVRRLICKSTSFHARLLRARLIKVARSQPAGWSLFHRVRRNQILAVPAGQVT